MKNPITIITKKRWKDKKISTLITVILIGVTILSFLSVITWQKMKKSQILVSNSKSSTGCDFPAIFNFGDSNSDTGSSSATFDRIGPPNGVTFFGQPAGRLSDGRLMIDFVAEKLRLPYLSAYLDSIGSNFSNGANFAVGGATIKPVASMSPLHLGIQLSQFDQLKARSIELHYTGSNNSKANSCVKSSLPISKYFAKALYTMDMGQNDLHAGLTALTEDQVKKSIPGIVDQFSLSIETLYQEGARAFWIHNTGPIGCLPVFVNFKPPKPENTDPTGCVKSYNEVAQEFNKQLKDKVSQLRTQLKDASLSYVDIYSAKYYLISKAKEFGFVDPLGYCCGHHGIYCWDKAVVNSTEVHGAFCEKPSQYISWDSIHYTESANHWIANRIMDGSLSDLQMPISEACQWYVKSQ